MKIIGHIDFYIHSVAACGLTLFGWIGSDWDDKACRCMAEVEFSDERLTGEAKLCLYYRDDVKDFGHGFVLHISSSRDINSLVKDLVIHLTDADYRLTASHTIERLVEKELIPRVRQALATAVKTEHGAAFLEIFHGLDTRSESRRVLLGRLGLPNYERTAYLYPAGQILTNPPARTAFIPSDTPMLVLIATCSHIPYADIANETFLKHNLGFRTFLLLVDGTEADRQVLHGVTIILLDDLNLADCGWLVAKLDATELANTLKPVLLQYLTAFGTRAVYLDCDIAVFGPFDTMMTELGTADLVLTPHMLELFPRPEEQWRHPNNADIFNSGLINAGCFAINLKNSQAFLTFWQEANLKHAWAIGDGRQTDQQFLNWALIMGGRAHVLQDRTYNVAYWNLHERSLRHVAVHDEEPQFEVEGSPLVFFHFSGFDPYDTLRLSHHDHRYSVYTLPSVALILEWYSRHLLEGKHVHLLVRPYGFDRIGNGMQMTPMLRQVIKRYDNYLCKSDTRTLEGANELCALMMMPLPATGSRLPLIAAEIYEARPDLQLAYPNAHVDLHPNAFYRWFLHYAGSEFQIEPLVAGFRRVLDSDSLAGFVAEVEQILSPSVLPIRMLGDQRRRAASELYLVDRFDVASVLLTGETEWFFFSNLSAVLTVYAYRSDLQKEYPDPFGRDHNRFLTWLRHHGTLEQGLSLEIVECFATKSTTHVLARVFSFLSRIEKMGNLAIRELLLDEPTQLFRDLYRSSGDGLEYDLADVEVLCFLHRNNRACLIPLYLELPAIRRQALSSRTKEGQKKYLPVPFELQWVQAGCRLHESYFPAEDVALEHEIRRIRSRTSAISQDVISVLYGNRLDLGAEQVTRLAEREVSRTLHKLTYEPPTLPSDAFVAGGVNLFGFFLANTGVGESSRGLEKALSLITGVRRVHQFTSHLEASTRVEELYTRYDHHADCNIFVSYPHAHEDLFGRLPSELTGRRRNIIHLAWEQRDWNTHWRSIYSRYDEIWAISSFAAMPFREMLGAEKVQVVPNVLQVEHFPSTVEAAKDRFQRGCFRFLFVFDANSSIERKNPEAALKAFSAAFGGSKWVSSVELVLKINNLARPEHNGRIDKLRRLAATSGLKVVFDGRQLAREEILLLIASADCYISLHRAEGFGYTLAEAMYLGVPVIASGYSGNLEYMSSEDSYLVPCTEVLVRNADGPFQRGSVWGEPDIEVAADMMRDVVENRQKARKIGERAAAVVRRKLLPEVVAEGLKPTLHRLRLS